jgi:hypothetical protein
LRLLGGEGNAQKQSEQAAAVFLREFLAKGSRPSTWWFTRAHAR